MKQWYQSKLLWLGVLQIVVAVVEYLAGLPVGTTVVQAVSGILTIVLRLITTQGIGTPPSTPK